MWRFGVRRSAVGLETSSRLWSPSFISPVAWTASLPLPELVDLLGESSDTPSVLQVVEPILPLLPTETHPTSSAVVLPLSAGELNSTCCNVEYNTADSSLSQSEPVDIRRDILRMVRGPESRLCWLETAETHRLTLEGFPFQNNYEDSFPGIQVVEPNPQLLPNKHHQESSPILLESDESLSQEDVEVPFISGCLTDRGVTDIGLKLHALREAFATHLACIDNQNFLFVMGKKIVMHLAAVNNQDAVRVKLAYEDLIWFLKTPSYQDSIAAELSEAHVYHYNFVDVFYELLLFGYITNGSIPDTFEGGPLERLFVLISMWNVDVWEPAAKIYFTVLIDQLTDLAEALFTQPPEFYYDPAALATTLRPLLRQHVQKMMDILEKL
ncbi:hypothetical protein QTP86_015257 [Hemibagrus guttatus]|nr:hypothetical protein QTP86_015257 [Hemibagrus guttatus]